MTSQVAPCIVCGEETYIGNLISTMRQNICKSCTNTRMVCQSCRSRGCDGRHTALEICSSCKRQRAAHLIAPKQKRGERQCCFCRREAVRCTSCKMPLQLENETRWRKQLAAKWLKEHCNEISDDDTPDCEGIKCYACVHGAKIKCAGTCHRDLTLQNYRPCDLNLYRHYGLLKLVCKKCAPHYQT